MSVLAIQVDPRQSLAPKVQYLERLVDEQAEEIRQLRALLNGASDEDTEAAFVQLLGLTWGQARILLVLRNARVCSRERLMVGYAGMSSDGIRPQTLDVQICHIRKRLPRGVRIHTVRGLGYSVDAESARQLDLIASRVAA